MQNNAREEWSSLEQNWNFPFSEIEVFHDRSMILSWKSVCRKADVALRRHVNGAAEAPIMCVRNDESCHSNDCCFCALTRSYFIFLVELLVKSISFSGTVHSSLSQLSASATLVTSITVFPPDQDRWRLKQATDNTYSCTTASHTEPWQNYNVTDKRSLRAAPAKHSVCKLTMSTNNLTNVGDR